MLTLLHRSPFTRKLNVVCDLAGLLARSLSNTFPSQYFRNSGMRIQQAWVVVFSRELYSRFTIHAKNLQLRG